MSPHPRISLTHHNNTIDTITGRSVNDSELLTMVQSLPIHPTPFDRTLPVNWLANLYFDTVKPATASMNLRKEISSYPILSRALTLAGWHPRKRHFTPRQIAVLFHYLGSVSAP